MTISGLPSSRTVRRHVVEHVLPAVAWISSWLMLVVATITNSPELARWALWFVAVAVVLTAATLAHRVVNRLTQIISLWAEDVPLDDDDYDCDTIDLAHRREHHHHNGRTCS